jgi:hypothetical protein
VSDASALLRLHRWLAAYGIPDRCFVTASAPAGSPQQVVAKARKPLYVDFASPCLVAMFDRLVAAANEVVFCEALPRLGDQGEHVTELVLETIAEAP